MDIKIGDGNKFSGNNAVGNKNVMLGAAKASWVSRHPILTGIICGLIVAVITSFWWWVPVMKAIGVAK